MQRLQKSFATKIALATAIYFAALVFVSRPIELAHRLLGNDDDVWIFYWNDWWLREAASTGQSPLFTEAIFAPNGTSLLAHSNSFLNSFLALLIEPFFGPTGAYNLVVLFGLGVGALGMFLLVYTWSDSFAGALFAGFVFAMMPYHLTRALEHGNLGSIHWWPWFAWALWQTVQPQKMRTDKRRYAIIAGLFAALTFWSGLQIVLLLALWAVFFLLWFGRKVDKAYFGRIGIIGIVSVILCAPLLIPLIQNLDLLQASTATYNRASSEQTDLLAYITPPYYSPFFGERFHPFVAETFTVNYHYVPYIGIVPLALIAYALVKKKQSEQKRLVTFWMVCLLLSVLLALGSQLRWAGTVTDIRMPFSWVDSIFPFSTLRSPDRFNLLMVFAVSVLSGFGFARLWQSKRYVVAGCAILFILFEFAIWPLPTWHLPPDSDFYTQLAQTTENAGVVDYPTGYNHAKRWLYFQTLHGRPTVDGHVSRYDATTYEAILETPLLRALYAHTQSPKNVDLSADIATIPVADAQSIAQLQQLNIRYVIHHHTYSSEKEKTDFSVLMPFVPIFEDDAIAVYDFDNIEPIRVTPKATELALDVDFGGLFELTNLSWEQQLDQLVFDLRYEVTTDVAENYKLFIHVRDESGQVVAQSDSIPCAWTCPTIEWRTGDVVNDSAEISLKDFSSSIYTIAVGFYDEQTGIRLLGNGEELTVLPSSLEIIVDR